VRGSRPTAVVGKWIEEFETLIDAALKQPANLALSFPNTSPLDVNSPAGQTIEAAAQRSPFVGRSNDPIVIDEPEAHLDSALIARYLVGLVKRTKRNRQVIFATHNANFVVNGDAELVTLLDVGTDHRTTAKDATIENLEHRARLLGLEGGQEGFGYASGVTV